MLYEKILSLTIHLINKTQLTKPKIVLVKIKNNYLKKTWNDEL